jgi:hypothetical protein
MKLMKLCLKVNSFPVDSKNKSKISFTFLRVGSKPQHSREAHGGVAAYFNTVLRLRTPGTWLGLVAESRVSSENMPKGNSIPNAIVCENGLS